MENLVSVQLDSISATNQTFNFFYPNEEPPKPSSLSFHLAIVMMHEAISVSKKYAVAMGIMKSIPNLNPENAGVWLAKLPLKIIKELWDTNEEVYVAVKNAINNKFKIAFFDLKLEENLEEVRKLLSNYNDLLGLDYKTKAFWITAIKIFANMSDEKVHIVKRENPNNDNILLNSGDLSNKEIWIPWVGSEAEFKTEVLEITFMTSKKVFYIWQIGDSVYSSDKGYENPGTPIDGYSKIDGDRKLLISKDSVKLQVI